jgi:hypothetical protein
MRKRFRLLALAAVLCVAAGSLLAAGCGGDDDADAGAKLVDDDEAAEEQAALGAAGFAEVYVQIAGGAANAVDPQATLDATTALYEKVKGSPAP